MPHSAMMVGSGNKTKTCETTVTDKHVSISNLSGSGMIELIHTARDVV